jgi:hypothetical protein
MLSVILMLMLAPVGFTPSRSVVADPKAPGDLPHKIFLPFVTTSQPSKDGNDIGIFGCNEPHTAVINPLNPHNIAVGACGALALSIDFGRTFPVQVNSVIPPTPPGTGGFRRCGDDSLAFDSQGRLFWSYLLCLNDTANPPNRLDITLMVQQVNPTAASAATALVGNAVDVTPGNFPADDKAWLAADANPASPFADNLYVVWSRIGIGIQFSRSVNANATWSAPQTISAGGEGFVWPSHVAVAPNGDVYVAYHGDTCGSAAANVFVLRDSSGGINLSSGTAVQKTSFQSAVTCNVQGGAGAIPRTHFWMQGALAPYILPDPIRPGNVYVIANDNPGNDFTTGDAGDVILARSTNYGNTWNITTISHAPTGTLQVFPTGAIDQDGRLMAFWYDTRRGLNNNGPDGTPGTADDYFNLDVYATASLDGGLTFSNDFRINDVPFDPDLNAPCRFGCGGATPTLRIGEYNGAAAADGIGYAAWTGTGQQILFDVFSMLGAFADRYEPNNAVTPGVVTNLGSRSTYNETGLTLHTFTDEDFFKFVALHTGKLTLALDSNSRLSDIDIQAQDKFNPHNPANVISTSTAGIDSNDTETIVLPVVAGETYFLRVFPQASQQPPFNVYNLNVINTPAPTPLQVTLAPGSDSGRSDHDNVTNVAHATVRVRVDDSMLGGLSFSPNNGTSTFTDDAPGYKVVIYRGGGQAGFATPVVGQPGAFDFTFAGVPLSEGLNMITARVIIVDPSDNPDVGGIAHVVGLGPESSSLVVTLDTTSPAPPSAPDLLPSSDSGASNTDNVTRVNPPAFQGTGEANDIIRMRASGVQVGEGTVGSDGSNGILGDGLGAWEVTIEPLADGAYTMTADLEDLAGNFSEPSAAMDPALVLDTPDGGGMPQRPTLDLIDAFDTGRSDQDNNTYLNTLDFRVSAEPTSTVVIKDGNTVIQTFVMPPTDFTTRTLVLTEGPHPLSTESTDLAGNTSHQSEQLLVTVDTTAPITPTVPDLLSSSDSGGISIDNITTVNAPTFGGSGEPNTLVKLYANNTLVGEGLMNSLGAYQVQIEPLADGVYSLTTTYEDLAGNVSAPSAPLKVTIAKHALNLPGATTDPASGNITADLNSGTIVGYPGVPGGTIGIVGIPTVNLDVNGHALTILGTTGDDSIEYSPTGPQAGSVTLASTNQVLNFINAGGPFTIDPVAGNDTVTTNGTPSADVITVTVTTNTLIAVNDLKVLSIPTINAEKIAAASGQSVDLISVNVYDTVDGNVFIDAGQPTNVSQIQDELNTYDRVGNAQIKNLSSGPVPGSGSVTFDFVRTTGRQTRVDYVDVEKFRIFR